MTCRLALTIQFHSTLFPTHPHSHIYDLPLCRPNEGKGKLPRVCGHNHRLASSMRLAHTECRACLGRQVSNRDGSACLRLRAGSEVAALPTLSARFGDYPDGSARPTSEAVLCYFGARSEIILRRTVAIIRIPKYMYLNIVFCYSSLAELSHLDARPFIQCYSLVCLKTPQYLYQTLYTLKPYVCDALL